MSVSLSFSCLPFIASPFRGAVQSNFVIQVDRPLRLTSLREDSQDRKPLMGRLYTDINEEAG